MELSRVAWLSAATRRMFATMKWRMVEDVLQHLPVRWEDRRKQSVQLTSGEEAISCRLTILGCSLKRFGGSRSLLEVATELVLAPHLSADRTSRLGEDLTLRWFNMPFLYKKLAAGMEMMVYGKVKEFKGKLYMDHPDFELLDPGEDLGISPHRGRWTPIYRLNAGLEQKPLREAIFRILADLSEEKEVVPGISAPGAFEGWTRLKAFKASHFPEDPSLAEQARRYLAVEEFYVQQIAVLRRRRKHQMREAPACMAIGELMTRFLTQLPYDLTHAQKRCLNEIRQDIRKPVPMNRLLHGDVGSGKTAVALASATLAIECGYQVALMAPTQILAEQQFLSCRKWLEPLGIQVRLLTGSKDETLGSDFWEANRRRPDLVVGTHALLYGEHFDHLGLVIIDEQHKFGVDQRAGLIRQGKCPHVLVMTATPIPRTLTFTLYGDLEVSLLDEMPTGRGRVITLVRDHIKVREVTRFLKDQIADGRQIYLVFPLVEEGEQSHAKAAVNEFEVWKKRLAPHAVGLLHGRMSGQEKESTMADFRDGKLAALVATTVIEVGIDVPNATVMMIFDAQRFGLAQLHQLRGRVGRGAHKSWCVLFSGDRDPLAIEKLEILAKHSSGFAIAEEDFKRRGPGDVLGQAQSGFPTLKHVALMVDLPLLMLSRKLAAQTIEHHPELAGEAFQWVRTKLLDYDATYSDYA